MSATTTNTFAGLTADQWRERAVSSRKESRDSFDRCDTDGFLSQWANDQMSIRYEYCADVADNNGIIRATALFHNGELVERARLVEGRYGFVWVYDGDNGPIWLNESQAQKAETRRNYFHRKHPGYSIGWVDYVAALNSRTGEPYATGEVRSIVTDDDTDFGLNHNNAY